MSKCKYQLLAEEVSTDGGQTWTRTGNTRKGALIEFKSQDCSLRIDATLGNGTTAQIPCTSTTYTSTTINRSEATSLGSNVVDVTIGGACVTTVGTSAFSANAITSVTIEEGVTTIGASAFRYNPSLTQVDLPSTITSIGDYAFDAATGSSYTTFTKVIVRASTPPTISANSFVDSTPPAVPFTIYVPDASITAYQSATNWENFRIRGISTLT